ncbi:MAG: aminomethyl-transferring glycine dehydrogenase subunit GcvPA [Eubacteriales bacterium]|nr:aminomethyl-transferring glycine dehydrogenase subunit GcvPA [Eubacteriales bacterium]MDD4324366.1 aminomethyl-transferring glycine dehydrogenase subunit GcvPA [Eubacteriales bacterium]MDD4540775.1 aminomethyl-transferring glycine dehydrogenase subunit GcvPA [Eubacteriales bacterium]
MTAYLPMDREERREMLASVGVDLDHLFDSIQESQKLKNTDFSGLEQEGYSEFEVVERLKALADLNKRTDDYDSYLGAGFYDHYQPAAVKHLISRTEYLTAYTPYQAEISQGTLQAIFEWQSYISRLTGMDISNASMYDGASAAAEAALMACREKRLYKVFVSQGMHPEFIETIQTYCNAAGVEVEVGALNEAGQTEDYPTEKGYAAFMVQSPNFYGVVEDLSLLVEKAHAAGALAAASCDLISLALLQRPGDLGVDIVTGEAQALGIPMSFGGPGVGYMAVTQKLLRKMPGRITGETVDRDGKTSYVLTIQAREQHIRRERATSNICTSQALMATSATIWLALMGASGIRDVAEQSAAKALYLQEKLLATGLFENTYNSAVFREFALTAKDGLDLNKLNQDLLEEKIFGGLVVDENRWLLAVTEKKSKEAMDKFVETVERLAKSQ